MRTLDIPAPGDQWQFTIELVIRPDGTLEAVLTDCRRSLLERGAMRPHEKLYEIADLAEKGITAMRSRAEAMQVVAGESTERAKSA